MRRSMLTMLALLAVATSGCEQVKGLIAKIRGQDEAAPPTATAPSADTALQPTTPATGPSTGAQAPPPPQSPVVLRDEPYVSEDTGTVAPGMTEREVYALWGAPAAVRKSGDMTYLYFKNGCEYSCGTMDVVFLQNGGVIDAIVRWPGHGYSGESSSPPGRKGTPTPATPTQPSPDA